MRQTAGESNRRWGPSSAERVCGSRPRKYFPEATTIATSAARGKADSLLQNFPSRGGVAYRPVCSIESRWLDGEPFMPPEYAMTAIWSDANAFAAR
jgi:hypothetical protein